MANNETEIKRKLMQTLADVNTLKEETQQIVKVQKRNQVNSDLIKVRKPYFDKIILQIDKEFKQRYKEIVEMIAEFKQEFVQTRKSLDVLVHDKSNL